MTGGPVLLDSDTLSELSRGHAKVTARARAYLEEHGRLTISSVSIFERLRGYRAAILLGKPLDAHLRQCSRPVARVLDVAGPRPRLLAPGTGVLFAGSRRL